MTTEHQTEMMEMLKTGGLLTTAEIAQKLALEVNIARSELLEMQGHQLIGRRKETNGGIEAWHIPGWVKLVDPPQPKMSTNGRPKGSKDKAKRKPRRDFVLRLAMQLSIDLERLEWMMAENGGGKKGDVKLAVTIKARRLETALKVLLKAESELD